MRVYNIIRQFVADGPNSFWTLCIVSDAGASRSAKPSSRKSSVDYCEVLSAEDFALYARLRELRKELAERDGVPTYAVFTNEQPAAIVQRRAASLTKLREIDGIGEARVEKYGSEVLHLVKAPGAAP